MTVSLPFNRQVLFALFLTVINVVYFFQSLTLPTPFALGEPGPAFLPLILSAILFVSCGRIIYKELRGIAGEDEADEASLNGIRWRALALIAATAAFIFLFEPLGYWPATLLYTFVVAFLFEWERTGKLKIALPLSVAMALGITTGGWLFFVSLFDLVLPMGNF
ncbi:tripartite tricarboxylate transporter TctB family protein [Rhodobacteraceae bacterium NNCM2]|nr:tripartite tricarboxylate transporter TctB family protein [Coraliihabitans acroporae]